MAILGKSRIEELEIKKNLTVDGDANIIGSLDAGNIEDVLTDDASKIPSSKAVFEGTIKTATASAEKVDADSPAEVTVTTEDRNSNFHFKIPSGDDGKNLLLQADSLFFKADSLGNITEEQTITLVVQASNLNEQVTWNDPSIPAGTMSYVVTAPVGPSFNKTFTVTADGLSSTLTIGTINEGDSPYVLVPSTDNFIFSADSDGNVPANELTTIGSFQILYGSKVETLSDWSISSSFQPTANFSGTVSTEGQISVSQFSPASDIGYITITATKGDNTVSRTLRCVKAKSGETPIILALENDNYVFTIKGGTTSELDDVLPAAVSAFRILEGNKEQSFTIGTNASGWGVSAVFTAVVNDATSTDASLFAGDLQSDGTIRVTTFSPTLQYGEIVLTAIHPSLGTLNAVVSVRAQKSAGFGTPTATAETLQMGEDATVAVTADASSPETSKVFNFQFGIPRGKDPIFISLNPDSVAVPASMSGYVEPSINIPAISSIRIYEGPTDITEEVTTTGEKAWTFSAGDPDGNYGSSTDAVVFTVDSNGNINLSGWKENSAEDSFIRYVTARRTTDNVVLTKGIMFYKAKAGIGQTGPAAGFGEVTAVIDEDETGTPRIEVATDGPNTAKNMEFTFYNVGSGTISNLYNEVNTATDGAVTPNAVRTYVANMTIGKAVYTSLFTAETTSYQIPNYTAGQDVEVYFNGLYQVKDTDYTLADTGVITFANTLGGVSSQQKLVVVCKSMGTGSGT